MNNFVDLTQKLGTFRLFEGVTHEELKSLQQVFVDRIFRSGELLTEFDKLDKHMFFIVSGKVHVTVPHVSGDREEFICDLKESDTVGEFLLARTARRTASCLAYSDVETLVTDGEELSKFLQASPVIGVKVFLNLSRILCERLTDNNMLVRRVLGSG